MLSDGLTAINQGCVVPQGDWRPLAHKAIWKCGKPQDVVCPKIAAATTTPVVAIFQQKISVLLMSWVIFISCIDITRHI